MKNFKNYYFLILMIITLSTIIVYKTYAMFTSKVETDNIVNMDTIMNYTFDINGTQEITIGAKTKARFNAIVKNSMNGNIYYGLYYKMINPTTLPSDIIIAQVSDDLTFISKGIVNSNNLVTVPLVIQNNGNTDITVQIGVRTGYVTDNQGVDDIIYNESEIPITSFLTNEEAGDDKYISTMECTTECIYNREGDIAKELCYCYTGKETTKIPRTSDEMLKYLGLTAKTATPDFTYIATTDEGIYSAEDNYGKSYYFRGATTNNYVKFANKWWRIIRINGNGTIRMIYDGTTAHNNKESSTDRQIGTSNFNSNSNYNAYVGYVYGAAGSSIYAAEHANKNNSTIKGVVDGWYKTNIEDKGFGEKVADVIYCNDRELNSGTGVGKEYTTYKVFDRLKNNKAPKLTCTQQNDAFTVKDEDKGNGALTYPVGLITTDEVAMAGGVYSIENSSYYLYIGQDYWTSGPSNLDGMGAAEFYVRANGLLYSIATSQKYGVRPVISLRNDVELTGNGTINSPFEVQT